jgi:hypothetical protein
MLRETRRGWRTPEGPAGRPAGCCRRGAGHRAAAGAPGAEGVSRAHTFGPKATPPPTMSGELREPRRACPVPFCAYGFLPPPFTSARVSVLAVPCARKKQRQTQS